MDENPRNEVSGTVHGPSVQAHLISGVVHVHAGGEKLLAVHEELNRVRAQLVESMRAERDITQVVWVLQTVLMQLQATIARLTWERDGHREELHRTRDSHARTEQRLVRAESEREQALRLVEIARARVLALESRLGSSPPAPVLPSLAADQVDIGLDMVDRYLDEQGERLRDLSAALDKSQLPGLTRDKLTGLLTKRSAVQLLDHLLAAGDQPAVLVADLDRFKLVNDAIGHRAGDEVLVALAKILEERLPANCSAARYSGDEFMVVCTDTGVHGGIDALAVNVSVLFRADVPVRGRQVAVTASLGAAEPGGRPATGEDLVRFASTAMAHAKLRGPGLVSVASRNQMVMIENAVDLDGQLRDCLLHGLLRLDFQPIVHQDGRVDMVEALVRWPHPYRGLLLPDQILRVAEYSGKLRDLDIWVLGAALREAVNWPGDVAVTVNLSGLTPDDPEFVDVVESAVDEAGIAWNRVVLELTETVVLASLSRADSSMRHLVDRGVRFALDGFGTGYSSLARLRDLPVQIIKVDRTLVAQVGHDGAGSAVALAAVSVARAMEFRCVAVGVETPAQFHVLRGLGVDSYQGWLFARPVPGEQLRDLLARGPLPVPLT
ncbi:EAL domain-containing protein [Lentzea tibetensis]|uniref:EAL domain-containing protein n=1 Tax=Lentzea tibetensis TaxID=2591470 RepID=A0A563ET56_9PSEU|nr:EAL domain-containing protein [Lentzea tibetensis]TWP50915.1 EAL domain-containing protein [Lentzea tibetensis]